MSNISRIRLIFFSGLILYLLILYLCSDEISTVLSSINQSDIRPRIALLGIILFGATLLVPIFILSLIVQKLLLRSIRKIPYLDRISEIVSSAWQTQDQVKSVIPARKGFDLPGEDKSSIVEFFIITIVALIKGTARNLEYLEVEDAPHSYDDFFACGTSSIYYFENNKPTIAINFSGIQSIDTLEKETVDLYLKHKSSDEVVKFAVISFTLHQGTAEYFVISRASLEMLDTLLANSRTGI